MNIEEIKSLMAQGYITDSTILRDDVVKVIEAMDEKTFLEKYVTNRGSIIDVVNSKGEEVTLHDIFKNGGEIVLSSNILLDESLVIPTGKEVVLDLNGKTISNKSDNSATDVIVVNDGGKLTINGNGKIVAVGGNDGFAVIAEGEVTILGGDFETGIDQNGEGNACIYARKNGKVRIEGGSFKGQNNCLLINKKDSDRATTVIECVGGKYYNFNPADNGSETTGGGSGHGTNFVPEGYMVVESKEGKSTVYTVVEGAPVKEETNEEVPAVDPVEE